MGGFEDGYGLDQVASRLFFLGVSKAGICWSFLWGLLVSPEVASPIAYVGAQLRVSGADGGGHGELTLPCRLWFDFPGAFNLPILEPPWLTYFITPSLWNKVQVSCRAGKVWLADCGGRWVPRVVSLLLYTGFK